MLRSFAFDEDGQYVAYAVASEDSTRDGLYVRDLKSTAVTERPLDTRPFGHFSTMSWSEAENHLAFLAVTEDEDGNPIYSVNEWPFIYIKREFARTVRRYNLDMDGKNKADPYDEDTVTIS